MAFYIWLFAIYEVCPKSSWTNEITSQGFIVKSNYFAGDDINMYGRHTGKFRPVSSSSQNSTGFKYAGVQHTAQVIITS